MTRRPAALEERPPGPEHHRRGQQQLQPVRRLLPEEHVQVGEMAAHLEHEHRQRQRQPDPEAAGSCRRARGSGRLSAVTSSGSSAMPQIGQLPGPDLPDLGVHRAGVDRVGRGRRCRRPVAQIPFRVGREFRAAARRSRNDRCARHARDGASYAAGSTLIPHTGSLARCMAPAAAVIRMRSWDRLWTPAWTRRCNRGIPLDHIYPSRGMVQAMQTTTKKIAPIG